MGKGNRPSLFRNMEAYGANEDYWDYVERKKGFPCWKCKAETECAEAYTEAVQNECKKVQ